MVTLAQLEWRLLVAKRQAACCTAVVGHGRGYDHRAAAALAKVREIELEIEKRRQS